MNALLCKQYYCDKCDKGFKAEQVTNVMYGVMCVEGKTVRKKMTAEFVLIVTRKLDLSLVTLLIIRKEKERYKYYGTFFV